MSLTCPLCNKTYLGKRIVFTLVKIDKERYRTLNFLIQEQVKQNQGWLNACPWCFEKSIEGESKRTDDENILDVFNSLTQV